MYNEALHGFNLGLGQPKPLFIVSSLYNEADGVSKLVSFLFFDFLVFVLRSLVVTGFFPLGNP
jgi:hypothetical protein